MATFVKNTNDNKECETADASLIAGTSWLFAREGMSQRIDYLFIDEAGQVSLADALAMGTAARNIVLLGDPQQLPQVTQGVHPRKSGCSVLEHLLDGSATVPDCRSWCVPIARGADSFRHAAGGGLSPPAGPSR